MVVLVASLGLEVLPCAFVECVAVAPGGQGAGAFCLEPLQTCDAEDSLDGVLFDFPFLLPGGGCLFPSTEAQWHLPDAAAFAPDGFHAAIEHPPQLSL
jgi:hypothetical protein